MNEFQKIIAVKKSIEIGKTKKILGNRDLWIRISTKIKNVNRKIITDINSDINIFTLPLSAPNLSRLI